MLGINFSSTLHQLTKSSILLDFTPRSVGGFRANAGRPPDRNMSTQGQWPQRPSFLWPSWLKLRKISETLFRYRFIAIMQDLFNIKKQLLLYTLDLGLVQPFSDQCLVKMIPKNVESPFNSNLFKWFIQMVCWNIQSFRNRLQAGPKLPCGLFLLSSFWKVPI